MQALVMIGNSPKLTPYIFGYLEQLSELNYETTLLYWARDGIEDSVSGVKTVCFNEKMKNQIPKVAKIKNFLKYRKVALELLEQNKYDRIIVCTTQFAMLLSDVLLKKYKGRYIFDYRDPSFENIGIYKRRLASIVHNSKATFISSDAYRRYLPQREHIYTTHNITMKDLQHREVRRLSPRDVDVIRISFWGCIRDAEINLNLIKGLANDERFELHYYGTIEKTASEIVSYCKAKGINNVYIHKEYLPDERYDFAAETDIIHSMQNHMDEGNPRMANRFYDGIIFYIPQICTKGSFMALQAERYGVGISIAPTKAFADELYNYYKSINWPEFEASCDKCLETVLGEYENSRLALIEALS